MAMVGSCQPGRLNGEAWTQARCNLKAIAHLPEAEHLVRAMLAAAPKRRPGAHAVMAHPFFWAPGKQLAFLIALSDRVECEDREVRSLCVRWWR